MTLGACGGEKTGPGGAPELVVTPVLKRDVPITSRWVGTLKGYGNAQIRPKVSGYILSQPYREGTLVHKGDLLFRIDPKQFQAAIEQARFNLEWSRVVSPIGGIAGLAQAQAGDLGSTCATRSGQTRRSRGSPAASS